MWRTWRWQQTHATMQKMSFTRSNGEKKFTKRPLYIGIHRIHFIQQNIKNEEKYVWHVLKMNAKRKTASRQQNFCGNEIFYVPLFSNEIKRRNVKVCSMFNRIKVAVNKWKCDDSNSDSISRRISIFFAEP